ncbi:MAG: hypothetical protein KF901_28395 [Myxococcales bacterium]|nr:hypothetical protein [Myxococcales bacterium]
MTSSSTLRVALLVGLATAFGCSLIIDTDPYVGGGDRDGGADGGDGGEPAFELSTPGITLAPERPRTRDDLVVSVVTESVDPLEGGPVRYEIRWRRDDTLVDEVDGEVMPATETAKGQTFRVEVQAVSADGLRRSAVATESVTIENTPPRLTWVALQEYRPFVGESVAVTLGPILDEDDDPVMQEIVWYVDDVASDGRGLTFSTTGLSPDARIRAEVVARDPDAGEDRRTTGAAIVRSATIRWRPLIPKADLIPIPAPGDRVVLLDRDDPTNLWEIQLPGGRLVRLYPGGDEVADTLWPIPFEVGGDLVFPVQERTSTPAFWRLRLEPRGEERWERIAPTGDAPSHDTELLRSFAFDPEAQRLYMVLPVAGGVALFACNFDRPGFETWTRVSPGTEDAEGAARLVGAFVADPTRRRALIFGGVAPGGATPAREILALDFDAPEDGLQVVGTFPESAPALIGTVARVSDEDAAYFADPTRSLVYQLDLATLRLTERTSPTPAPERDGAGFTRLDSRGESLLVASLASGRPSVQQFTLAGALTSLVAPERFGPQRMSLPVHVGRTELRIFERDTEEVWTYTRANTWRRVETLPDAMGNRPVDVPAQVAEGSSPFSGGLRLVDGTGVAWSLPSEDRPRWVRHTPVAAGYLPFANPGMATSIPGCGGDILSAFGGEIPGTYTNETPSLTCDAMGRSCNWVPTPAPLPAARAYSSFIRWDVNETLLFGGVDGTGVYRDVRRFENCSSPRRWQATEVEGPLIPSRWGHSATLVPVDGEPTMWVIGGNRARGGFNYHDDVWRLERLELGRYRWSEVSVADEDGRMPPRHLHVTWFDLEGRRIVVVGGNTGAELSDVWALHLFD